MGLFPNIDKWQLVVGNAQRSKWIQASLAAPVGVCWTLSAVRVWGAPVMLCASIRVFILRSSLTVAPKRIQHWKYYCLLEQLCS